MAKPTTNAATRPTTPAQLNIAKPAIVKGMMPIVDKGVAFQRTVVYDAKTAIATADFLVKLSENHEWSYRMTVAFAFPKGTPEAAALWAVRALRVDAQSRFRSAAFSKDAAIRASSSMYETWAKHDVTTPDERTPADPAKAAAREKSAIAMTIAALRRAGKAKEADALAAATA